MEGSFSSSFVISEDGQWLIVGNQKGKLNFWNILKKKFLKIQEVSKEAINKITLLDKDKLLIVSGKKIYLRNITEDKNIQTFDIKEQTIHQMIATKSGENFLTLSLSAEVNIWNIHKERPVYSIQIDSSYADIGQMVDFSSDGKEVAIAFEDGTVKLYSSKNLKVPKKIFIYGDKENWVVFDEKTKKMRVADEGNFLLKKHQMYKDKNVTIFEFERYEK